MPAQLDEAAGDTAGSSKASVVDLTDHATLSAGAAGNLFFTS